MPPENRLDLWDVNTRLKSTNVPNPIHTYLYFLTMNNLKVLNIFSTLLTFQHKPLVNFILKEEGSIVGRGRSFLYGVLCDLRQDLSRFSGVELRDCKV